MCAVAADGRVLCWGYQAFGRLGRGRAAGQVAGATNPDAPAYVVGPGDAGQMGGVRSVAAGAAHTCALSDSGAVYCWGRNNTGQLGTGDFVDHDAPVRVQWPVARE